MKHYRRYVTYVGRVAQDMPSLVPVTAGMEATVVVADDRFAARVRLVSLDYERIYVQRYRAARRDAQSWEMTLPAENEAIECFTLRPDGRYVSLQAPDAVGPFLEFWKTEPPTDDRFV